MAVRDAAKRLDMVPVGSLGIVVKGYKKNRLSLSQAAQYLEDLYNISSLFITHALVDLALDQLR